MSMASARAAALIAASALLRSFTIAPWPLGPQWTMSSPIASNSDLARAKSSGEPPAMIVSVPSSARGLEPVTGASTKPMPRSASRDATVLTALGAIVLMSMARAPSARPSAAPFSPNRTCSTCGASTTIVMTMSACSAAARGGGATGSPRSSARGRVRFQTTTSKPAPRRLRAMREPMIPRPRNATRSAVPAAAWGVDSESVTGSQATRDLGGKPIPIERVPPDRAIGAAGRAAGRVAPALGDQAEAHIGERLQLAHDAVAATVGTVAARATADGVLDRAHRELALERLDWSVERVAHRDVHGAWAVSVLACTLAPAERFVVGEVVVA